MGFRAHNREFGRWRISSRTSRRRVFVVSVLILALLAIMQVPHLHQNPSDADHCALCVVMHTAAPAPVPSAAIVVVPLGFSAPVAKSRPVARYWHPQLFTRPPPILL